VRLHVFDHGVEVVRCYFHKLAILQFRQRFCRLAGEVSQYTHDERQFFNFDGVANFHVVRNLYPRWPHSIEFVLRAVFCHNATPKFPKDGGGNLSRPRKRNQSTRKNRLEIISRIDWYSEDYTP
jgi:hypothetical protein